MMTLTAALEYRGMNMYNNIVHGLSRISPCRGGRWAVQKKGLGVRRAVMWALGVLALIVALLTAIAQLGEALVRVVKAWRPILF